VLVAALSVFAPLGTGRAFAEAFPELEAEAAALEEAAAVLEEAADDAPDDAEAEALDELAAELLRLADEIRDAESPSDAIERLEREAEALRERAGDDLLGDKAAVHGLEQQLQASPLAPSGGGAAAQLEALADLLEGLTPEQLQELADRLDRLAESQSAGNPGVAEQLENAASALRAGDASAAGRALNDAAAAQRVATADIGSRGVASAAAQAASASAGRLRNPGEASAAQGDGSGQGGGEGEGSGQGEGSGEGSGSGAGGQGSGDGSGSGTGGSGGGGAGEISGVSPSGGQSAGQGGQGAPGAGAMSESEAPPSRVQVFDPADGGPSDEVGVDIAGGVGEGEVVGRGDATTTDGDSYAPLQTVLPSYLDTAATALDELHLPPDLRSTVRDYFDHLAEN